MQMELNIGLDVEGVGNTEASRNQRAQVAMDTLGAFLVRAKRFTAHHSESDAPTQEHRLFVRLETNKLFSIVRHVYRLAQTLEQDHIAVFYPDQGDGVLIGPQVGQGRAFDRATFRRFDATPARLEA